MTNPTYDYTGQVALVTGAASGMGLAAARGFAENGAAVALLDRSAETVEAFGRLDMAFDNAGVQAPPSDAADEEAANFDQVNAVNLRGVWAAQKHELRHMRSPRAPGRS